MTKTIWINRKDYDRIKEGKCAELAVEAQGRPAMAVYISAGQIIYDTREYAQEHPEWVEKVKEIAENYDPDNGAEDHVVMMKEE